MHATVGWTDCFVLHSTGDSSDLPERYRYSTFAFFLPATMRRFDDNEKIQILMQANVTLRTNMLALVGSSFPHPIQTSLVSFMISVRKVEARNSESSIHQIFELRNIPACGAQRAHDLALAFLSLRLGHDLFQRNVGAAKFRARSSYFGIRERHVESSVLRGIDINAQTENCEKNGRLLATNEGFWHSVSGHRYRGAYLYK